MMHEPEKSDLVVVAGKPTNKAARAAEEPNPYEAQIRKAEGVLDA